MRQLQYRDGVEAFYVARRPRVDGGIRTEAYDNEIRVDNVQHGLMGLLKARDLLVGPYDRSVIDAGAPVTGSCGSTERDHARRSGRDPACRDPAPR